MVPNAERLLAEDEAQHTIERLRGDRNYWCQAYAMLWREGGGGPRTCVSPAAAPEPRRGQLSTLAKLCCKGARSQAAAGREPGTYIQWVPVPSAAAVQPQADVSGLAKPWLR